MTTRLRRDVRLGAWLRVRWAEVNAIGTAGLAAGSFGAYSAAQSLVFTPNPSALVERRPERFYATIWDEAETNALAACNYYSLAVTTGSITDYRFP